MKPKKKRQQQQHEFRKAREHPSHSDRAYGLDFGRRRSLGRMGRIPQIRSRGADDPHGHPAHVLGTTPDGLGRIRDVQFVCQGETLVTPGNARVDGPVLSVRVQERHRPQSARAFVSYLYVFRPSVRHVPATRGGPVEVHSRVQKRTTRTD